MVLHVVFRGSFFLAKLKFTTGEADEELAVPACFANFAECECAVFADCETLGWWWEKLFVDIAVIFLGFCGSFGRGFLLTSSFFVWTAGWSLTPLSRTVDCSSIRLQPLLSYQFDVSLHSFLIQGYLEQFAGLQQAIIGIFTTVRVHALDIDDVAFGDAGGIEILQT